MATSKTTTKSRTTKATATTTTATTDKTTTLVKELQAEVTTLRAEVSSLKSQVADLSKVSKVTTAPASDDAVEDLRLKVLAALRKTGVREWVLSDTGLKRSK